MSIKKRKKRKKKKGEKLFNPWVGDFFMGYVFNLWKVFMSSFD